VSATKADDDRIPRGGTMGVARRVGLGLLLACTLGGCPPFGLARGDYWAGISTGDIGPCPSFDMELAIHENRIDGSATTDHSFGMVLWDIRGVESPQNEVMIETRTGDPRVARQIIRWTGKKNAVFWYLTETPDPSCPKPRTIGFQRK
jgi:hypothetical protein